MEIKSVMSKAPFAALVVLAVFSLNACSSQEPKPDDAMVRAKTAVDQAVTGGSAQYAAVDLNNAQTELQGASGAQTKGDYKQARYLAEDAEADAGLALAKTQAAKAAEAAKQVQQGTQALQKQVNQPNNPPQR
jgi:hypothetical protein